MNPTDDDAFHDAIAATIAATIERDDDDDDDGAAAKRHLAAGRAIYVSDPRYPGKAMRAHPDGHRELMQLDAAGQLVVADPMDDPPNT